MAANPPSVADAFLKLQAGDAAGALACARAVVQAQPGNARAHLAAGIALRMEARFADAAQALARAQAIDARDHAAAYEMGVVHQLEGHLEAALERFEHAARLKPDFFAANFAAGLIHAERGDWRLAAERFRAVLATQPSQPDAMVHLALALAGEGHHAQAEQGFVRALAANPHHAATLKVFGQYSISRGNYKRAASLFAEAARLDPGDAALPMFVAQSELLVGRWSPAWAAYAHREPRREFERAALARAEAYVVPRLDSLSGREVTLVGEQGLGDTLFMLRWAPLLEQAGARLAFAGDERLHSLLARTGLFGRMEGARTASSATLPVLVGDLPSMCAATDPASVPSLTIAPLPERRAKWESVMRGAGPRPWIGVQWRAGTAHEKVAHALSKSVPADRLFAALAPLPGTLVSLQRAPEGGELERHSQAAGRAVHDLAHAHNDLEDLLAIVALLDRHIAVSSTSMHLATAAGASADVLVPFPPEWRWRAEGASPWFPGFRVHRQTPEGDWDAAISAAVRGA